MNKLTLNPDTLRVESFHTDARGGRAGAVHGYLSAWSDNSVCPGTTTTRPPF